VVMLGTPAIEVDGQRKAFENASFGLRSPGKCQNFSVQTRCPSQPQCDSTSPDDPRFDHSIGRTPFPKMSSDADLRCWEMARSMSGSTLFPRSSEPTS
jgi:hypothetical protein